MLTKNGIIKRTSTDEFANIRSNGIRAVTLKEDDELVFCALSDGASSIIIATAHGLGIRFKEDEVRAMGRQAAGVIGIRLKAKDYVVGMQVVQEGTNVLFATQMGYGKQVSTQDFRVAHRGGLGVRTIPTDKRNGLVIGLVCVTPRSNILLIDETGKIIRLSSTEIRTMGRQAKGVRLIKLDEKQKLATIVSFEEDVTAQNDSSPNSPGSGSLNTAQLQSEQSIDTDIETLDSHDEDTIEELALESDISSQMSQMLEMLPNDYE